MAPLICNPFAVSLCSSQYRPCTALICAILIPVDSYDTFTHICIGKIYIAELYILKQKTKHNKTRNMGYAEKYEILEASDALQLMSQMNTLTSDDQYNQHTPVYLGRLNAYQMNA